MDGQRVREFLCPASRTPKAHEGTDGDIERTGRSTRDLLGPAENGKEISGYSYGRSARLCAELHQLAVSPVVAHNRI